MSVFPLWLPPNRAANDFRRRRRFPRVLCVVTHHPRFLTAGQQVATTAAAAVVVNVANTKSRICSYMHNDINSFAKRSQVITTIFTVSDRFSTIIL